ncbi:MAG: ABC transporter permease [Alistipes sp.]|nr:ABC transporter permease [Alistipes sp.]
MNLEYFIANRTAHDPVAAKPNVMVRIATASVAIGLAVMIVTMAVVMGFKEEIARKVSGFTSHVQVTYIRSSNSLEASPIERNEDIEQLIQSVEGFRSMSVYALKGGVIKTSEGVAGLVLKGIGEDYDTKFFAEALVEGELPRVADSVRYKDILLPKVVADRLNLEVGSRVEMLFIESDALPRRDRFKVCGLFSTGMDEMDKTFALTDIRNVQRLADWNDRTISGYEISIEDFSHLWEFTNELNHELLFKGGDAAVNLVAMSVEQLYGNLFNWLKTHNVNALVIIIIMIAVALFNMMSALLIMVLERTRMVGVLKALGMNNGSLQRVFLYRAAFLVVRGMVWGNVAGIGLCLLQKWTHLLKLDASGYMLSEVPIALDWWWLVALNAGVLATIVLLLIVPARIVASVRPEEAMRYE